MATPAQIIANQSNAQQKAQGPALGLFSTASFVRADEREEFEQFKANHAAELCPQTPLEETLAREIVHASWRLRRCAIAETNPPEAATEQDLDRLQASVDRARASAQRSLHRSLAELRRVQTERLYRAIALPASLHPENPGQASCRQLDPPAVFIKQVQAADDQLRSEVFESAKQTQSCAVAPINVARNAPCPCGSRENHVQSRIGQALSPPAAPSS